MDGEGKKMHRENLEVSIHSPTAYLSLGETRSKTLGDNNDLGDKNAIGGKTQWGGQGRRMGRESQTWRSEGKAQEPLWGCHVIRSLIKSSTVRSVTSCLGSSDFWAMSLPSSSRDWGLPLGLPLASLWKKQWLKSQWLKNHRHREQIWCLPETWYWGWVKWVDGLKRDKPAVTK